MMLQTMARLLLTIIFREFKKYLFYPNKKQIILYQNNSYINCKSENLMNILLVDDDISSVSALANLLQHEYSLEIASNGIDALKIVESSKIDVVITDIKMPKMNGIKLLKSIRNNGKNIYVILITGYPDEEMIKEAKLNDAFAFILKPIEVESFMQTLKKIETEIKLPNNVS
jgi:two-component system, response regulator YesN